jgi:GntR family transcriptional regulator
VGSITLEIKIDRSDPTLLHEQVAAAIRRSIADGDASAGDRLPPARDLAAVLGVNQNTVLRALRLLRDEGLLTFRRGQGVRVAGSPRRGIVLAAARDLLRLARHHGYPQEELVDMIRTL